MTVPTRAVAQGTFDLLHPGHIHYLKEAATYADELHVIVARRANVTHKEPPILSDRQRQETVGALGVVDTAHRGHAEDIFVPIEQIDPDVIVLGHDQHHDADAISETLADRGIDCQIERATAREPSHNAELLSSRGIIDRILEQRG